MYFLNNQFLSFFEYLSLEVLTFLIEVIRTTFVWNYFIDYLFR